MGISLLLKSLYLQIQISQFALGLCSTSFARITYGKELSLSILLYMLNTIQFVHLITSLDSL